MPLVSLTNGGGHLWMTYKIIYSALGENYFGSLAAFFSLGSQSAFTCSTLTMVTPKQCLRFIQK